MAKISRIKLALSGLALVISTCLPVLADVPPKMTPLAELWVHTSAEYRGLCYQAYNTATLQFDNWEPLLEKRDDGKAYLPGSDKPVAIILDLDETVIDNSGFQSFMYRTGATYTPEIWAAWVDFQGINKAAGPTVPGVVEFLAKIDEMGVTPVFVSNRAAGFEKQTIRVLNNAGINMEDIDNRIFLKKSGAEEAAQNREAIQAMQQSPDFDGATAVTDGEGHKEGRRLLIKSNYDVLAYFGDVYGDFVPFIEMADSTKRKFEQRRESADANRDMFGASYFILPNPMYGYWSVGKAIPKDEVRSSLNDYGFETYLRGRRILR